MMDTKKPDIRHFVEELVRDRSPLSRLVFSAMFSRNLKLAQLIVDLILSRYGVRLELTGLPLTGYSIDNPFLTLQKGEDGHSVRLDVLVFSKEGDIVNIEGQRYSEDLARRMGFYTAILRTGSLAQGEEYGTMPHIWTIWITDKDPFDKGEVLYHFRGRKDEETGAVLDDNVDIIVFNAKAAAELENDSDLCKLGHDFTTAENSKEMMYNLIADAYRRAAETREAKIRMEDRTRKIFEEFKAEVVKERSEEIAVNMMRMNLSNAQIAEATRLSPSQVNSLRQANHL